MNQKWVERFRIALIVILSVIFVVSAVVVVTTLVRGEQEQNAFEELAQQTLPQEGEEQVDPLAQYQNLKAINSDFCGWVYLEGTKLNYPVMYTPSDSQYYLRRDFEKKNSLSGTPFVDGLSSPSDSNVLIHGHNMKNGTMFNALVQYEDEQFWTSHPVIQFNTPYGLGDYQVMAAFYTKISGDPAVDPMPYYEYAHITDEQQFQTYVSAVQNAALYQTGVTASYGDQLLTLSTCDNVTNDGRFVVVAVKAAAQTTQEPAAQTA